MTRKFLHLRYVVVLLLAIVIQISVLAPTAYGQAIDHSSLPQSAKAATCPTPPDGFDILHASLDEIHYYGLPRPPEGSTQERANWAKDFQEMHFTHRICGDGVVGTAAQPHHLLNKGNNEGYGGYRGNSIWEGYYASNGGFTRTIAKWYVPSYCCSNSKSNAGEWVGIGGVNSSSIWQAGTETDPEQGYRMWYEAFPNSIVYAGPAVSPGNQVYVNVDYNWTYSNESYVYMYNYANGQSYSAVKNFHPGQDSADWIIERAGCPDYLPQISQVNWSNAFAQSTNAGGNTLHNIGYYSWTEVDMKEGSTFLESTSTLGTDSVGGSTFTSTYDSHGTMCY